MEGKILAEELLDSAMMTMRTTKLGEERLDKHPSLYQQYLAKLKATRRLRTESFSGKTMEGVPPTHELTSAMGMTMRSYAAADGERMAKAVLLKRAVKSTA